MTNMNRATTQVTVAMPFSQFGGKCILSISEKTWYLITDAYQESVEHELEDEEGEVLIIDLYNSVLGAKILDVPQEHFYELHDRRFFEALCLRWDHSGGTYKRFYYLESPEVAKVLNEYGANVTDVYCVDIFTNELVAQLGKATIFITQTYDEDEDECTYKVSTKLINLIEFEVDGDEEFLEELAEFLSSIEDEQFDDDKGDEEPQTFHEYLDDIPLDQSSVIITL